MVLIFNCYKCNKFVGSGKNYFFFLFSFFWIYHIITEELKFVFRNSVGIFFFGGPDIPPAVYGEENTLSVVTDHQATRQWRSRAKDWK
jgi:hypothetical protein